MVFFLSRRFLLIFFSFLLVVSLTFFLMHSIPGDPFSEENALPAEIMDQLMSHYGLDQPWYVQYFRYIKGIFTFDLGPSFKYEGRSISGIIAEGFPISLVLGLEALLIAIACGTTLGTFSAWKQGRWQDFSTMVIATLGISMPSFLLASLLQYVFAMKLHLLPVARWGTFAQTILPAIALAGTPTAFIARLTRSNLVEVKRQDYALTARAKGLGTYAIVFRHLLRNALLPVVTYLGPLTANIITGSFIVEKIFGIPGLGSWLVRSIINRDYTTIMGITIFYCAILMVNMLIVDIVYTFLDPRISFSSNRGKAK